MAVGLIVCVSIGVARAELVHGFVDLGRGAFDFSTQTQYPVLGFEYIDIAYCIVVDPPIGDKFCMWNASNVKAVPDSTVEAITYAPTNASEYQLDVLPVEGRAYVVKTGDGFYAKFAIRRFISGAVLEIEYFVQMNGGNSLRSDPALSVQHATWGRVKVLYVKH